MSHDRKDNPAGRLHLLFEDVLGRGANTTCSVAWRAVMQGTDEDDFSEADFLQRMSTAYKLPLLVREIVPHIPALEATQSQIDVALTRIEKALETHFSGNVQSLRQQLADSLGTLNMVSGTISTSGFSEPVLEDEFLERTRTDLASLYSEIEKSSVSETEKVHLLNLINLMNSAIIEVEVGGSVSLRSAASEVLGVILSEHQYFEATEVRQKIGLLAWNIAGNVVAQGLLGTAPAIGDGFRKIIEALPSG